MQPIGPADTLPVAWLLARRFSGRVAALTLPMWLLIVSTDSELRHDGRTVTGAIRPPGHNIKHALRFAGAFLLVAAVAIAGLIAAALLLPPAWFLATGLVIAALFFVPAISWIGSLLTGRSLRTIRKVPRGSYRIDTVASSRRCLGLGLVADYARATVPAGSTIAAVAASDRHLDVYKRYGFVPLHPGSLVMVGTA
ncbi:hypothetical protein GCM10025865_33810 (plasmid) [Paraoerskovia sediminicola]|uniref:PH domain-containing protein n=1 Tax=Paraoerskovia sediminicola TaxID=1138587 RepID=A0ABM8G795_9CELL|nr:hypothetical protein [Paraoerskovia sediminicola]BDZ44038.1 hypothetical protein GCM10025865_33370 [Paraoerskovia sediminicola]BDZ44082.1 hypothetical protein GCM10025865_33810 [Paraoerskovia sediminicola]